MESDFKERRAKHEAEIKEDRIPTVEPADLKTAWVLLAESEERFPGQIRPIHIIQSKSPFSLGADMRAIMLRVGFLRTLKRYSETTGHVFPWLHDGRPDDSMFELFATGKAVSELQKILKEAGA